MSPARTLPSTGGLPDDPERALLVGRVWLPERDGGPTPVLLRNGGLIDIGDQWVDHCDQIPPWRFSIGELMTNLARRGRLVGH